MYSATPTNTTEAEGKPDSKFWDGCSCFSLSSAACLVSSTCFIFAALGKRHAGQPQRQCKKHASNHASCESCVQSSIIASFLFCFLSFMGLGVNPGSPRACLLAAVSSSESPAPAVPRILWSQPSHRAATCLRSFRSRFLEKHMLFGPRRLFLATRQADQPHCRDSRFRASGTVVSRHFRTFWSPPFPSPLEQGTQ